MIINLWSISVKKLPEIIEISDTVDASSLLCHYHLYGNYLNNIKIMTRIFLNVTNLIKQLIL